MKLKKVLSLAISLVMICSSTNAGFAENQKAVDTFGVGDELASGQAIEIDDAGLYASSIVKYPVEGGYIYFDESTGTITDCDTRVTSAVIPDKINGISVTRIADGSVTYIGSYAYWNGGFSGCWDLTSITIPDSVTSIGDSAFNGCTSLISITIPEGVTNIGEYIFSGCTSLTSITIPDSVTSIGEYTFSGCTSLTSITIPDSITSIGDSAFSGCTNLTSVTIPDSVTSIDDATFFGCSSLTSITIPNSVSSIGRSAFNRCGLTNITIPNSVTSIGSYAFFYCSSLTSIIIPDDVTSIDDYTFGYCTNLTSITIPDSVTSIGDSAFYDCVGLTSIAIPDGVTSIGDSAFRSCWNLTSITIPDSVTSIGDSAFRGCSSLISINIPDGIASIGDYTFGTCWNLTSITIPASVTSIGDYTFSGCYKEKLIFYVEENSYADTWAQENGYKVSYETPDEPKDEYNIQSTFLWLDKGTQVSPYKMLVNTEGTIDAVIIAKNQDSSVQIDWSVDNTDIINLIEGSNDKGYHTLMPVDNPSLNNYYSISGVKFEAKSTGTATITATSPNGWTESWQIEVVNSDENIPNKNFYNVEEDEEDDRQLTPQERLLKYARQYETNAKSVNNDITRKLREIQKKNAKSEETAFNAILPQIRNMYTEKMGMSDEEKYAVEKAIFYYLNTMVNEGEDITDIDLSKNEEEIGINLVNKIYDNLIKDKKTYKIDKYEIIISFDIGLFGAYTGHINIKDTTNPDKYYDSLLFNSDIDTSVSAMRAYCEQLRQITKNALNYGINSYIDYFTSATGLDKYIESSFKKSALSVILKEEGFAEAANIVLDGYEIYTEVKDVLNNGGTVDGETVKSIIDKGVGNLSAEALTNKLYKKLADSRKKLVAAAIDCYEGTDTPESEAVEKISFFKKLIFKCPVDIYIYDKNGNEIGSIAENVITENSSDIKIDVDGDAKYIYLINDVDVSCRAVGYSYGILNVTEELGYNDNIIAREMYYNIPVYPDDVFTKNIDSDSLSGEDNNIYRNGVEIEPSEYIEATEDGAVSINATAKNGSISGAGIYAKGDPVALLAIANNGYYFAGWYKGDTLVSTSSLYEFSAREDSDLTALFEKTVDSTIETSTESTTVSITEGSTETTTEATTSTESSTVITSETTTSEVTTEITTEVTASTEPSTETTYETTTSAVRKSTSGGGGAGASSITVNGYKATTTTEATTEETTDDTDSEQDTEATTEETIDTISNDVKVTIESRTVVIGDESYEMDAAPYIQSASNSTLVPLRFVALAIAGGDVENADGSESIVWDAVTKTAKITFEGKTIEFTAGSDIMVIDGRSQIMDNGVKAEITEGRMFVPFRALGEALGVDVEWDAGTKTAIYKA